MERNVTERLVQDINEILKWETGFHGLKPVGDGTYVLTGDTEDCVISDPIPEIQRYIEGNSFKLREFVKDVKTEYRMTWADVPHSRLLVRHDDGIVEIKDNPPAYAPVKGVYLHVGGLFIGEDEIMQALRRLEWKGIETSQAIYVLADIIGCLTGTPGVDIRPLCTRMSTETKDV